MQLTEQDIHKLVTCKTISDVEPWRSGDDEVIENHLTRLINRVCETFYLEANVEYDYGSGYASYVDAWFYRQTDAFSLDNDRLIGLVVLFNRLTHHFVVGEGVKYCKNPVSSSYLPGSDMVDNLTHPATKELAADVVPFLSELGLERLDAPFLKRPVGLPDLTIHTLLSEPPWTYFDVFFYWED